MPRSNVVSKETLVFYGSKRHELRFRQMFPELFEMYDVKIKSFKSWSGWPEASVGTLVGRGWRKICFCFA